MQKLTNTLLVFLVIIFSAHAQTKSPKRGVAYGSHSDQDLNALSKSVSWWYNWYHQPEATAMNVYQHYGLDYVPMAWNGSFNKEAMRTFLSTHPNVKYILGWNEPNFVSQANMTPAQAAALWPDIEDLADEFNLEIVSPAVNYCDVCVDVDGVPYSSDPIKYLDDFFAACAGCRVDHIAIHCYMGNVSALEWYVGLFKKYDKPIWLTEFANWENNPTLQDQKNFLVGAVDYLENDEDVFRYAWFTGRHTGAPYIGLLGTSGKLTELGQIYVNMPLHDPDHYEVLPATLEAENYNSMSGILLELTTDVSGFANVGYIDASDWLEYGIDVPEDGDYQLAIRTAGTQHTSIRISLDGAIAKTISIPSTGGWQTWTTVKDVLALTTGQHKLRIQANAGGFNLNWFELKKEEVLANNPDERATIEVYPNPTEDQLYIKSTAQLNSVEVVDLVGRSKLHQGNLSTISLASLVAGHYYVKITTVAGKSVVKKILKK